MTVYYFSTLLIFVCLFVFVWNRTSLCSLSCPGTLSPTPYSECWSCRHHESLFPAALPVSQTKGVFSQGPGRQAPCSYLLREGRSLPQEGTLIQDLRVRPVQDSWPSLWRVRSGTKCSSCNPEPITRLWPLQWAEATPAPAAVWPPSPWTTSSLLFHSRHSFCCVTGQALPHIENVHFVMDTSPVCKTQKCFLKWMLRF
jgi:hypothetical protein